MGGSTHGQAQTVAQALIINIFCIFRGLFRAKLNFLGINLGQI
jgi:hypothetical protein